MPTPKVNSYGDAEPRKVLVEENEGKIRARWIWNSSIAGFTVRNTGSGGKVKEYIVKQVPEAKVDVMGLDLGSMDSVRTFASD